MYSNSFSMNPSIALLTLQGNFTPLDGHYASGLPATKEQGYKNKGDFALTNFPFYFVGRDLYIESLSICFKIIVYEWVWGAFWE